MHIDDMIAFWANAKPHHPAIIQPDTIITYRGLADAIGSICLRLESLGLDPGEPVAVAIEHPAKQLAVTFALLRSGYVAAPVYRALMPHLQTAGIKNIIYEAEGLVMTGGKNIRFDNSWLPSGPSSRLPPRRRRSSAAAPNMNFFTSGATGLPKKVVQTEAALIERMNVASMTGVAGHARVMILPGLGTNFGFSHTCAVLRGGNTVCFSLPNEGRLVLISTYGVEQLVASPQQALALVALNEGYPGYQLDSLKAIWISGAPMSRSAIDRVKQGLCRNVYIGYGSTEASLIAIGSHEMFADVPDAAGFVGPWAEVEIVDDAGHVLPPGAVGRIRCRTSFLEKNHAANNPGAPDAVAWHATGDIGSLLDNGVLCVHGRGDEIINCGGLKVSAAVLDEAVLSCAGVRDGGICGVKGESGIEEVWIGLVTDARFQLDEFQRQLDRHPQFHDVLKAVGAEVMTIDAIPRNELGKIQRHALRQKLLALKENAPP
jgi:acyl-coenzyme A synthetase/AMP-(fatty) acid ligase